MIRFKIIFSLLFIVLCSSLIAQTKIDSLIVYGNCGMCKVRIEKAAIVEGVKSSEWDMHSKMLTVVYDTVKTNRVDIEKRIASVGHDTDRFTAPNKVYDKLPLCCLYERKEKAKAGKSQLN